MMNTAQEQTIQLHDGRSLGFVEHGRPDGFHVFFFHGTPGSRKDWDLFSNNATAERLGVRLIAVDRPGMGLSNYLANRHFLNWPQDVTALADALRLARFSVLGYSSGGAYALACANQIPERLEKTGVVSGDGPYEVPGVTDHIDPAALSMVYLARTAPGVYRVILRAMGFIVRYWPGLFMAGFRAPLLDQDRVYALHPAFQAALRATVLESLRGGPRGAQLDTQIMVSPWGFEPRKIRIPVHLWYGESDKSTSPLMGRYLAEQIPGSVARFFPNEGHVSLISHFLEEFLGALLP